MQSKLNDRLGRAAVTNILFVAGDFGAEPAAEEDHGDHDDAAPWIRRASRNGNWTGSTIPICATPCGVCY